MNPLPQHNDWQSFVGWEVFECPKCGTQWGLGTGGKFTKPPTCTTGHEPIEMEQKFDEAMPRELRDRAENNPDIRVDMGDAA